MKSIRIKPLFALSCLLFLAVFFVFSSFSDSAEVVKLTDDTFEHRTQASTGGTTGSWLILFHLPNCNSCNKLKLVLDELGNDEELYENGIVLGSVDCSKNPNVCHRFSTTKLPVLIYLRKKRLYRYPLKREHNEFNNLLVLPDMEKLKKFLLEDFSQLVGGEGEIIPDPPSALDVLIKKMTEAYEKSPLVSIAIFGVFGIMILTISILVVTLIRSNGGTENNRTKTKKSKNKEE